MSTCSTFTSIQQCNLNTYSTHLRRISVTFASLQRDELWVLNANLGREGALGRVDKVLVLQTLFDGQRVSVCGIVKGLSIYILCLYMIIFKRKNEYLHKL